MINHRTIRNGAKIDDFFDAIDPPFDDGIEITGECSRPNLAQPGGFKTIVLPVIYEQAQSGFESFHVAGIDDNAAIVIDDEVCDI